MIREVERRALSGWVMLPVLLFLLLAVPALGVLAITSGVEVLGVLIVLLEPVLLVCLAGFFIVNPNEGRVLQLFGDYSGTVKRAGPPLGQPVLHASGRSRCACATSRAAKLKVNDHDGNPIEIAAIVVWRVVDTAEAVFEVDDYENFVQVQSEAARAQPRDALSRTTRTRTTRLSLRGSTATRSRASCSSEIQDRLAKAGVEVIEARISHLAYAPEIAAAMLRRQQAGAIIAARQKIVEGAVGMVEMALDELLARAGVVELDEERKAAMVSNLLVVLCGERDAQPVVNTGTLYQ